MGPEFWYLCRGPYSKNYADPRMSVPPWAPVSLALVLALKGSTGHSRALGVFQPHASMSTEALHSQLSRLWSRWYPTWMRRLPWAVMARQSASAVLKQLRISSPPYHDEVRSVGFVKKRAKLVGCLAGVSNIIDQAAPPQKVRPLLASVQSYLVII